ncbi:MAG: helix-turn-helix transcriptional regulator [Xenococcaceae cyanobacterium MO_188.B32]|nr:helix-turn-helix transcriptional regulator [Xenococcaceae cyanobacterium MO_188.B32]
MVTEQEVIQLLAEGLRDREIAQKLFISDRTVKFHINNVVTKLNAKTRIQAIHQIVAIARLLKNYLSR